MEVDGAAGFLRGRAQLSGGAGSTIRAAEHGIDARAPILSARDAPSHGDLTLWAGHLFALPVDHEVGQIISLSRAGLPGRYAPHRPLERDPVVPPAADQQGRINVGRVHVMLRREEAFGGQARMDLGRARHVLLHRRAGLHVRDQVRGIVIAGLGDVDLVAGPLHLTLCAVMHLGIIGRLQPLADRRQFRSSPPARPPIVPCVMHPPHVAQRLHHRHRASRSRCARIVQGVEQEEPVRANLQRESFALLPALGQAIVLNAMRIALEPSRLSDHANPVRNNGGQIIESGAQRLGDEFQKMQVMHGPQHMRAVGALLAARLDQTAGLEPLEHGVQQQMLRLAGDKAGPELGEHAEVEPGISQLEPQRVLPVDPGPDSVGGLPIAEVLEELEDRDQSQPPRRKGGLPPARVEPSEVLILVEDAKFIPQPGHNVALRESCPGNSHGLGRDLTNRLGMKAHGFLLLLNSQQGIRRQYLALPWHFHH